MLAMRLFFWGTWPTPTPPSGQTPAATRNRTQYRVQTVTTGAVALLVLLWPF